jgi:hypothetical protein
MAGCDKRLWIYGASDDETRDRYRSELESWREATFREFQEEAQSGNLDMESNSYA